MYINIRTVDKQVELYHYELEFLVELPINFESNGPEWNSIRLSHSEPTSTLRQKDTSKLPTTTTTTTRSMV